ncbi:hypothetical protein B0A48_00288 [Cryoendolithus antarcticus]|uniref:Uncharacterized protein n=1 Tax=Cryoendolithus antarcticus TaxID=1507870 RepID=A0A1V8TUA3_9PEZI|nr:hypothetical protein B0A48_00288 [Cryoendolithus antarcticus]
MSMASFVTLLSLVSICTLPGLAHPDVRPRQTLANTTSLSRSASSSAPTISPDPITSDNPCAGVSGTCYDCGISALNIGLNSWWTSTYDLTIATEITHYLQYDDTIVVGNVSTIFIPSATQILGYNYWSPSTIAPGLPVSLAEGFFPDGSQYAGTFIAPVGMLFTISNLTSFASPTAWMFGPGRPYVSWTEFVDGTSVEEMTIPPTFFTNPWVSTMTSPRFSGSVQIPMPTGIWSAIVQEIITLPSAPGSWPMSKCTKTPSIFGEPTVHIPVNLLTVQSSSTSTINAKLGTTSEFSDLYNPKPPATRSSAAPSFTFAPASKGDGNTALAAGISAAQVSVATSTASLGPDKEATPGAFAFASSITISPGSATTVPGTTYSVPTEGSALLVNGQTASVSTPETITLGSLTAGITPTVIAGNSAFIIDGETLTSGGAITVGSQTLFLSATTSANSALETITLGSLTAAVTPTLVAGQGAYIIDGETLTSGGGVTVDGQMLFLSATESASAVSSSTSSQGDGVAAAIMSMFGQGSSESTSSESATTTSMSGMNPTSVISETTTQTGSASTAAALTGPPTSVAGSSGAGRARNSGSLGAWLGMVILVALSN